MQAMSPINLHEVISTLDIYTLTYLRFGPAEPGFDVVCKPKAVAVEPSLLHAHLKLI